MSILDLESMINTNTKITTKYLNTKIICGRYKWSWDKCFKKWRTPILDIKIPKGFTSPKLPNTLPPVTDLWLYDLQFEYNNKFKELTLYLDPYEYNSPSFHFKLDNIRRLFLNELNIETNENQQNIISVTYDCTDVESLERITNNIINIIINIGLIVTRNSFKIISI